jgi:hypothetical protein
LFWQLKKSDYFCTRLKKQAQQDTRVLRDCLDIIFCRWRRTVLLEVAFRGYGAGKKVL